MADYQFIDADFGGSSFMPVAWASYPDRVTSRPKIIFNFTGDLTSHFLWGNVDGIIHARIFVNGLSLNYSSYQINTAGTSSNPGAVRSFATDIFQTYSDTVQPTGSDSTLGFRYCRTPPITVQGQFFYAADPIQGLSGNGCVPVYPAGTQTIEMCNYALNGRFYGAGYSVQAGGGFVGAYSKFVSAYSVTQYVTNGMTDNTNQFPQKCFLTDTPPDGFSTTAFFSALINSQSSAVGVGTSLSAQVIDDQIMAVAEKLPDTNGGNTKNFRISIILFRVEDRPFNNCSESNVRLDYLILMPYFDVALESNLNTMDTGAWSLVSFDNGFILAPELQYQVTDEAWQEFAAIKMDGTVVKHRYSFSNDRTFTTVNNFCGIFVGPNGKLMYGMNNLDGVYIGQAETFPNPFPLENTAKIFGTLPVSGFNVTDNRA